MVVTLEFEGCSSRYRRRDAWAIHDVTLRFGEGRTILLGPNGAGKSTLLALGASALPPAGGAVRLAAPPGTVVGARQRAYRRLVGWMPQRIEPVRGLRVREQVAFAGWLKGMSRAAAWEHSAVALDSAGITNLAERPSHRLSGGQRARMGLAQTLVHDASVVLLDEPAAALDPDQRADFLALLGELAFGRVIVVSTHDVNDLASSFDRVVVLFEGRIRFEGDVVEFLNQGSSSEQPVDAYRAVIGGAV